MKQRVSIALATFNGENYFAEQLCSFVEQTRLPDELVISDDCSTDATVQIAREFAEKVQFEVKIIVNASNLGYAQNFSQALELCTGDVVFLSDQDDLWLPSKIETMLRQFAAEPEAQLLIHDLEYCRECLTPIGQTKIERMRGHFDLNYKFVVGMATALRGPFLKLCLPIPAAKGWSHDFWLHRCADVLGKKRIMHEVLALYRRHSANASHAGNLNVDFVTTAAHFKAGKFKNKTFLSGVQAQVLCEWLQAIQGALLEQGYLSPDDLDRVTTTEKHRLECITARSEILAKNQWQRLWPVLVFWKRGGYRFFSGWKSVVKDVFFN